MGQSFINFVYWIEDNGGEFPKYNSRNKLEKRMYSYWKSSTVKEIEKAYKDIKDFSEVPKGYVKYIKMWFKHKRENSVFKEILSWLDTHDGKMPKTHRKAVYGEEDVSKDIKAERSLHIKWTSSEERTLLDSYVGIPIEDVPLIYRDYIRRLREYGFGLEEKDITPEMLEWLKNHGGVLPRGSIADSKGELTVEEKDYEIDLRKRWDKSDEKKIVMWYVGTEIEEIPENYRALVASYREYGIGIEERDTYERIIEWLDAHNGRLPLSEIRGETKAKKRSELTLEEKEEVLLRADWNNSEEKRILDEFTQKDIEEVPEEYREKIQKLRSYGLGKVIRRMGDVYEEYIAWIEEHGKKPRYAFNLGNGKYKLRHEMTDEEAYELSLAHKWYRHDLRKILDEYADRPIEEVPEEYREKIANLRNHGILGKSKDDKIKSRMRKSVGISVETNQEVREELSGERIKEEVK